MNEAGHGAERLKAVFGEVIELAPDRREQFLVAACGSDQQLRARLDLLLRAHDGAGDFLDHPLDLVAAAVGDDPVSGDGLEAGDLVGDCELLEHIGRGGFGSVWRARQLRPIEREVALKILHSDRGRVAEWFASERQTLARMQHPGIASILDAGTTTDGRPWLTMELVAGQPITRFCEQYGLTFQRRLELFIAVCVAVQHAHLKGVVHNDLKPANVLVTDRDGALHPVVIDFGVASALGELADADIGEDPLLPGTPDYMSPEQASGDRTALDSRTDVYSLGVMLYELCSGQRPFHGSSAAGGIKQLLREVAAGDAPCPSSVASHRLPPEIDWITAKAMAKDPAGRYPTATALADDVRRLLVDEAVEAGPDSTTYRFRRFVRRHRVVVAAVALVMVSLAVGVGVAARGWWTASVAERQAHADKEKAEKASRRATLALDILDELLAKADASRLGRGDYPVRELLADCARELPARAAGEPEIELRVRRTLARLQGFLGFASDAEQHALRAVELARATPDDNGLAAALLQLGRARFALGEAAAAASHAEEAVRAVVVGEPEDLDLLAALDELLAQCAQREGNDEQALLAAERSLEARRRGGDAQKIARSYRQIAGLHVAVGRVEPALAALDEALALEAELGEDHPDVIATLQHRAMLLQRKRDLAGAEAAFRDSLARRERAYGEGHPRVAWAKVDLAWLLKERGQYRDAEPMLRAALPVLRDRLGETHLFVTETMQRLGSVLAALGRGSEAESFLVEAVERYRRLADHPRDGLVGVLMNLASMRWQAGEHEDARQLQVEALGIARESLLEDHYVLSVCMTNLAYMLTADGDTEAAVELLLDAHERAVGAGRTGEAKIQRQRLIPLLRQLGRSDEAEQLAARDR